MNSETRSITWLARAESRLTYLWLALLVGSLVACSAPRSEPADTLEAVRARGVLRCGVVNEDVPYQRLNADICRAVAAAVLGDAEAVEFRATSEQAGLDALLSGETDLLSQVTLTSGLDTGRALSPAPATFYTPEASYGALVREGDDAWLAVVTWTVFATFAAEEYGVTSRNVAAELASENAQVKRLLGVEPEAVEQLGLENRAFYNVIGQVGNYAEIYSRTLGAEPRGLNAGYQEGGLLYAPPLR